MFLVFLCGAERETRWASVVEGPHRAPFLGHLEMKPDSATSLLARGVKRRLLGGLPPDFNSDGATLCPAKFRNDLAACKASKGKQTAGDSDSLSLSQAGQRAGGRVHAEQPCQTEMCFNKNTIPASSHRPSHWQCLEESDADVAVDVDCCGDSGSASKLSSRSSGMSAYVSSKHLQRLSSRNACRALPTLSEQHKSLSRPMEISMTPAKQHQVHTTQVLVCVHWQLSCCLNTTVMGTSGLPNF